MPNILQNFPKGGIKDLTLSSSRSTEHEIQAVPRVNEPEIQTTNKCPISSVPIVAKNEQETSKSVAQSCPISSVPTLEKVQDMNQSNAENCPIMSVPIEEKTRFSLQNEGAKATGLVTSSVVAEQKQGEKSGEIQTSDKMETQTNS